MEHFVFISPLTYEFANVFIRFAKTSTSRHNLFALWLIHGYYFGLFHNCWFCCCCSILKCTTNFITRKFFIRNIITMFANTMGRKAKFDVKSLKIGQKLPFPANKRKYLYQYLNNFNRQKVGIFGSIEDNEGKIFIQRIA